MSERRRAIRVPGHKLRMEWSGEYGENSSSTAYCICGWQQSGSSQQVVRDEYRHHLRQKETEQTVLEARLRQ